MSGVRRSLVLEPDKWGFDAEEATLDEVRVRALLQGPDADAADGEMVLALLELLHDEAQERIDGEDGLLSRDQLGLTFMSLLATARRAGWIPVGPLV